MTEHINTISRLPNELCPAFMEWCVCGGHEIKVKKDRVVIRKGTKTGEIFAKRGQIQPSYFMSDYMIERFKLFSLQWLKYGKSFVNDLDSSMMSKFVEVHRQINLAKVAVKVSRHKKYLKRAIADVESCMEVSSESN